jgi:hypothetical protein
MKKEQNIFQHVPHLDLNIWEAALDAADHFAALHKQDIAIYWNPATGHHDRPKAQMNLGTESERPVGWKIVHVAKYKPETGVLLPILVIGSIILLAVVLLSQAVCNAH